MASQHRNTMDDSWADDIMRHDRRRPLMLGAIGLAGVAIVILFMLYAISQMAGY